MEQKTLRFTYWQIDADGTRCITDIREMEVEMPFKTHVPAVVRDSLNNLLTYENVTKVEVQIMSSEQARDNQREAMQAAAERCDPNDLSEEEDRMACGSEGREFEPSEQPTPSFAGHNAYDRWDDEEGAYITGTGHFYRYSARNDHSWFLDYRCNGSDEWSRIGVVQHDMAAQRWEARGNLRKPDGSSETTLTAHANRWQAANHLIDLWELVAFGGTWYGKRLTTVPFSRKWYEESDAYREGEMSDKLRDGAKALTLAEFRGTRRWSEDISKELGEIDGVWKDVGPVAGWLYVSNLCITACTDHGSDVNFSELIIYNESWEEPLSLNEERLYSWYISECVGA